MGRALCSLVLVSAFLLSTCAFIDQGVWIVHDEPQLRRRAEHHPWSGHGTWESLDQAKAYLEGHGVQVSRTMFVERDTGWCGTHASYSWYFRVSEEDATRAEQLTWRARDMRPLFRREHFSPTSRDMVVQRPPSELWQNLQNLHRLHPEIALGIVWFVAAVFLSWGGIRARRRRSREGREAC